jgi:hypothetical protein
MFWPEVFYPCHMTERELLQAREYFEHARGPMIAPI